MSLAQLRRRSRTNALSESPSSATTTSGSRSFCFCAAPAVPSPFVPPAGVSAACAFALPSALRCQVLEIAPSDAVKAVKVLRAAQEAGALPIEEVELYGSLVHVAAPDMKKHQATIKKVLEDAGISIGQMAVIEPSLEDVFISAMKA